MWFIPITQYICIQILHVIFTPLCQGDYFQQPFDEKIHFSSIQDLIYLNIRYIHTVLNILSGIESIKHNNLHTCKYNYTIRVCKWNIITNNIFYIKLYIAQIVMLIFCQISKINLFQATFATYVIFIMHTRMMIQKNLYKCCKTNRSLLYNIHKQRYYNIYKNVFSN